MIKKILAILLLSSFSLQASPSIQDVDAQCHHHSSTTDEQGLRNYAVFSNQAEILTGASVPWAPTLLGDSVVSSSGITVDTSTGIIRLPRHGVFLVEYTVRINRTPFDGTSTARVQLQQTVDNISTDINQASVVLNTSIDGITAEEPSSQTQITGFALITTNGSSTRQLNLLVTFDGGISIPLTSGQDANAQIAILQLN